MTINRTFFTRIALSSALFLAATAVAQQNAANKSQAVGPLKVGDPVELSYGGKWQPGTVTYAEGLMYFVHWGSESDQGRFDRFYHLPELRKPGSTQTLRNGPSPSRWRAVRLSGARFGAADQSRTGESSSGPTASCRVSGAERRRGNPSPEPLRRPGPCGLATLEQTPRGSGDRGGGVPNDPFEEPP